MITLRGKEMLFIEAHTHIWDRLHGRRFDTLVNQPLSYGRTEMGGKTYQFLPPEWADVRSSFEIFQLYESMLGFDKAVFLQTPCYGPQYEYINKIMAEHPGRYASVGVPNPQDKQSYLETARVCLGEYGYKALKFECPDIPFAMTDPDNAFVFETLMHYNAYCMIDMGWGDGPHDYPIDDMQVVVERFPDLTFIFPHLGVSRFWDPAESANNYPSLRKTLAMLEKNANIWFDLSGIPIMTINFEEHPYPSVAATLKIVKEFGALDRVMWGSDYPTALKGSTYRQLVQSVANHCDFLTDNELENIMGKTADKVWFGVDE